MNSNSAAADGNAPDVSFIIVNYNGFRFLNDCLDSLRNSLNHYTHETIVIDNASADESLTLLRARNDIRLLESDKNLGFTGGNNKAAKYARGRVLILLNNDTKINQSLDPLVDQVDRSGAGVAGARLVYGDGRTQFSVGLRHHPLRLVLSWLGLEKRHRLPSLFRRVETNPSYYMRSHSDVDWVSGACLATPRSLWNQLGGLDEEYFMYCEDVDYCLRVQQAGYKIAYTADTLVTHYEGAGKSWIGTAALRRTANSYAIYLSKHHSVIASRLTVFGIGTVFVLRSLAFRVRAAIQQESQKEGIISLEKNTAYLQVGSALIAFAMSGDKKEMGAN